MMIMVKSQILRPINCGPSSQCARHSLLISVLLVGVVYQLYVAPNTKMISAMTATVQPEVHKPQKQSADAWIHDNNKQWQQPQDQNAQEDQMSMASSDKRAFVMELLKILYEQYGNSDNNKLLFREKDDESVLEERRSQLPPGQLGSGPRRMHQLLEAIGADGDMRRLIDWIRNSLSPAAIPEVATQFVVSKLGAVNCPALLQPDREDTLIPRFLLFNEHFVDVPFELSINPNPNECITNGRFDPRRKTIVLVHGYLTGYTLVDGITNIKNRLLDLNRAISERAINTFVHNSAAHLANGTSFVYSEDLNAKLRHQMYNVILVDWFNGANPSPRANYIRSAVNAQVVGRLIARFLSALIVQCGTPATSIEIIAHSLGCHVTGFTGKALNAAGHRLGKITHLDPIGLCFGRLFSQPRFRLSPDDALETQAVHTSLNLFDNPLDGTQSNFLVNGGRDQAGCGGPSELTNSTTSSISLLFDPAAKFGACSHMRALNLFEDDNSSEPGQCQLVGYRCQNYDRFLAGKCGQCDATNSQCRLMSLPPISTQFKQLSLARPSINHEPSFYSSSDYYDLYASSSMINNNTTAKIVNKPDKSTAANTAQKMQPTVKRHNGTPPVRSVTLAPMTRVPETASTKMFGAPSYVVNTNDGNEIAARRSDRRLSLDKRDRIAQALEKLRADTRTALVGGWSSLRTIPLGDLADDPIELSSSSSSSNKDELNTSDDLDHGCDSEQSSSIATMMGAPSSATETTTALPTKMNLASTTPKSGDGNRLLLGVIEPTSDKLNREESPSRSVPDPADHIPIGSQKIPTGSLHGPLYFLGTSAVSSYCLNYYQFRVLVAESRLAKIIKNNGLGSNRLAPQLSQHRGGLVSAAATLHQQRLENGNRRDMLHLTVKLSDTSGRFFKGFSVLEHAHSLGRVMNEFTGPSPLPVSMFGGGPAVGLNEPMVELTMLLNSTKPEPQKVGEAIVSYYFHQIVLADRIEINYMSNISPE